MPMPEPKTHKESASASASARLGSHEDDWNHDRPAVFDYRADGHAAHCEPKYEDGELRVHAVHQIFLCRAPQ